VIAISANVINTIGEDEMEAALAEPATRLEVLEKTTVDKEEAVAELLAATELWEEDAILLDITAVGVDDEDATTLAEEAEEEEGAPMAVELARGAELDIEAAEEETTEAATEDDEIEAAAPVLELVLDTTAAGATPAKETMV